MKALILIILTMNQVLASDCNSSVISKLEKYKGRYTLGACKIELHLCEMEQVNFISIIGENKMSDRSQFWLGDLLITGRDGKTVYVPLYSAESRLANTTVGIQETKKEIRYSYTDKISDPISGFKEIYEVSFGKNKRQIEVSLKNSVESRKNPIRSLFFPNIKLNCAE